MEATPPAIYDAEFFLDPICPWCWITSRWVTNVQAERDLKVRWRFISLKVLNENNDDEYAVTHRPGHEAGRRFHRVMRDVRERDGNDALGRLYTAVGTELHVGGRYEEAYGDPRAFVVEALRTAGLDLGYADAIDDDSHDETFRAETAEALERTGPDVGTPILTFSPGTDSARSLFGPVMPSAPKGDDAVALWNAVATIAGSNVAELKRTFRGDISFS